MNNLKKSRVERDLHMSILDISVLYIEDNPFQPRQKYQKKGIQTLAKSITERGLLHPISVIKLKDKDKDRYIIIAGHRRLRAYKMLHRKTIPAIIRKETTRKDMVLDLAIENAVRQDFSPAERAKAVFQILCLVKNVKGDTLRAYSLVTQLKLTKKRGVEKVHNLKGNAIGFTDKDITECQKYLDLIDMAENTTLKYLRLLGLPKFIRDKVVSIRSNESITKRMIEEGFITVTMAYEISRLRSEKARTITYNKAIKERWDSVTLRAVVDELLDTGKEEQINDLGSSKRRGEKDYGLNTITKKCFSFSSQLWNFRNKFGFMKFSMNKVIYRASLIKLRKGCAELMKRIDENLSDREKIINVNGTFEHKIYEAKRGMRLTIPPKVSTELNLKHKDILQIRIEKVKRKS
jgi:hypothetical protein